MGGANYSSDQASSATIAQEQESQLDSKLSIGLSLFYSIYKEEKLDPSQNKTLGDQIKEQGSGNMSFHEEAVSDGMAFSPNDGMNYIYVDCSGVKYDVDACRVDDFQRMKKNLLRGLAGIYAICLSDGSTNEGLNSYDLYINLGGYDLIEDLVNVTNYILTGKESKGRYYENLKRYADEENFRGKFQQLKTNGWRFKVYTCIYSASETFAEGDENALKEQEKQRIKQENARIRAQVESGAFKEYGSGGVSYSGGSALIQNSTFSSVVHLLLGVGSLCVFFPPVALACSAADIAMHAIEGTVALNSNDDNGATAHFKDAAIGVFFIIPFGRIGKFWRTGRHLRAEMKTAKKTMKDIEREGGHVGNESVVNNEKEIANIESAIKEKKLKIEKDKADIEQINKDQAYYAEISPKEATIHKNMNETRIREKELEISKNESEMRRLEAERDFVVSKRSEYSKWQGQSHDYRENEIKYDVAYTRYQSYSNEVKMKNRISLADLTEDLKKEWNETHFLSLKRGWKTGNELYTVWGIAGNSAIIGESLAISHDE